MRQGPCPPHSSNITLTQPEFKQNQIWRLWLWKLTFESMGNDIFLENQELFWSFLCCETNHVTPFSSYKESVKYILFLFLCEVLVKFNLSELFKFDGYLRYEKFWHRKKNLILHLHKKKCGQKSFAPLYKIQILCFGCLTYGTDSALMTIICWKPLNAKCYIHTLGRKPSTERRRTRWLKHSSRWRRTASFRKWIPKMWSKSRLHQRT